MSSVHNPRPSFLKWAQGSLSVWHWMSFRGAGKKQGLGRRLMEKCVRNRGAGPSSALHWANQHGRAAPGAA